MNKKFKFFLLISAAASCLLLTSCSEKPEEVIKKYEKAFNSHDTNKLISLFSKDAVIDLSGVNKLTGIGQIKDYAEYDSVLHSTISISDITNSNGKSFLVMTYNDDLFKTVGINETKFSMIFKISGGKIHEISGSTSSETDKKIDGFRTPFMLWAAREKLDILNELMPEGNMIYNAVNAKKFLELVMEWKNSGQTIDRLRTAPKNENPHW